MGVQVPSSAPTKINNSDDLPLRTRPSDRVPNRFLEKSKGLFFSNLVLYFRLKSSDRIIEKFNQYKDNLYFDYAIYFFKSKTVFNAYRKKINAMVMEVGNEADRGKLTGKIIFLYFPQKHQYGSILDNSTMECQASELSIEKFFGQTVSTLDLSR